MTKTTTIPATETSPEAKPQKIVVDYQCNCEEFWGAVQDSLCGGTYDEPVQALLSDDEVAVTEDERDQLLSHLATFPGWDTGDARAPHPVCVVDVDC